ncbi:hypothetical protein FHG87_006083 [Trinorchestia longiramus]|nr:hypothetical protein FHG87_006083 [Trinorchestia longiramus]
MTKDTEATDVEMAEQIKDTVEMEEDLDVSAEEPSPKQKEAVNIIDRPAESQSSAPESSSILSKKEKTKKAAQLVAKIESKKEAKQRKIAEKKAFKQGIPLSGKWWKDPERKKFSSLKNKDSRISRDLAIINAQREERKFLLEYKKKVMTEREESREKKREKRRINQIRTLENQLKSEKLQIIKNPNTIKKMKRNQRKTIETRDISTLGPQNLVK